MHFSFKFFRWPLLLLTCCCTLLLGSCREAASGDGQQQLSPEVFSRPEEAGELQPVEETALQVHPLELRMIEAGMVDVQEVDSSLQVDLKYASEDNFTGRDMYQGMGRAFLQPEVAAMLARAQKYLKQIDSALSLVVYDAARPRSVQQQMWDAVDAPFTEKIKFLANPANGSIHNFGAAVDVSIVDEYGQALDMGTPFDYMGPLAYPSLEQEHLDAGELTPQQFANRQLLRRVMLKAGFFGIQTEWWHFNAMSRQQARESYQILE